MTTNLTLFDFQSQSLRTLTNEHGTWFCLIDLIALMGTTTNTNQLKPLLEETFGDWYKIVIPISDNLGRDRETIFISEPATTFIISRSRTEVGKQLNRWIHSEVLPSIRKTGSYTVHEIPKTYSEALRLAADLVDENQQLKSKIELDAPKVQLAEEFLATNDTIDVREFGKLTKHITGLGPNQLLAKLREMNLLQTGAHQNQPYQRYVDLGYFATREVSNRDNIYIVATITPKGQQWLINQIRLTY